MNGSGSATNSLVGNIYLGRVQNVLPSMEAAFVDIGRGRNAVLYAGEVDWDAAGLGGKARRIEQALSSGDSVLVQVTKDPVGHKGARLTTQISLAGRFLVYVPCGGAAGISRKLPDIERKRLKDMLREIVPSEAGVIIRTASEGVSQEALERDVRRLQAQWEVVKEKAEKTGPSKPKAPVLLYEEPDLLIKVVRDQFNEDFSRLVVEGDDAWETVPNYVGHVAPELAPRLHRHVGPRDVFDEYRIDEQLLKALDRKVWLPSGGTLVIDRTEAMTVIDVNTGKFTGSGRQPRGDRHPQQPRGGRGDRAPAAAARHRRHHRDRLHRHGARGQPRPGAAAAHRVPGPRPHAPPGGRGDLAGPGADDPQAGRRRPARALLDAVRALPGPGCDRDDRARCGVERARPGRATTAPASRPAGAAAGAAGATTPTATAAGGCPPSSCPTCRRSAERDEPARGGAGRARVRSAGPWGGEPGRRRTGAGRAGSRAASAVAAGDRWRTCATTSRRSSSSRRWRPSATGTRHRTAG